eukprot:gene10333-13883_t
MFPLFGTNLCNFNSFKNFQQIIRWATKKAGGSTRNGRDSIGKRLGLKKFGGEYVIPGNIIIRQRGKTYHNGKNTGIGRDYTVYALSEGYVTFFWDRKRKHQIVSVVPENPNPMPRRIEDVAPSIETTIIN